MHKIVKMKMKTPQMKASIASQMSLSVNYEQNAVVLSPCWLSETGQESKGFASSFSAIGNINFQHLQWVLRSRFTSGRLQVSQWMVLQKNVQLFLTVLLKEIFLIFKKKIVWDPGEGNFLLQFKIISYIIILYNYLSALAAYLSRLEKSRSRF